MGGEDTMFFSPNKMRDLVKTKTNRQVSQEYLFSLIDHLQEYTCELIQESEKEIHTLNEDLEKHGLRRVERLSSDHIRRVLSKKIIYQEKHQELEVHTDDNKDNNNTGNLGKSEPMQKQLPNRCCQ